MPLSSKEGIPVPSVPGTSDSNAGRNMEDEMQSSQPSNQGDNTKSQIGKKQSELSIFAANKGIFQIKKNM